MQPRMDPFEWLGERKTIVQPAVLPVLQGVAAAVEENLDQNEDGQDSIVEA